MSNRVRRHLDRLYFAAQRACYCREPDVVERHQLDLMEREADVLEFFEDFFAGFLQIGLQVYIALGAVLWKWETPSCKYLPLEGLSRVPPGHSLNRTSNAPGNQSELSQLQQNTIRAKTHTHSLYSTINLNFSI